MKITVIILLSACMAASAKGFGQQITLSERNATLQTVFEKIEKQTGYTFAYTGSQLAIARAVSIDIKNGTLEQVLKICFAEQPFTYSIIEKTIVVKPKSALPNDQVSQSQRDQNTGIDIRGRVTDEEGNGLQGASIRVKDTDVGTSSDAGGYFMLTGVAEDAVLEISYVGFEKKTLSSATFRLNGNSLSLKRSESPLDAVQVEAYRTNSKRLSTSNIGTVKSTEIEKQPVSNPLLALQGRIPSLQITQSSGFAGSGITVRIQGVNSINGGNDPLYVIDGVPYISQMLPAISTTLGRSDDKLIDGSFRYGNPLSYINPADIESIEVLKDADATAIFGSRAANGAILITTKKGKAGEQKIEFNFQQGWGKVTRRMDLLNLRQYLDMRYEALRNDGIDLNSADPTSSAYYDLKVWDTTRYTDWQRELIGNTAHYTDLQATISGGSTNASYLVGVGYHRETTVMPTDFNDQKASLHFQINSVSPNQNFRLNLTGNYMSDINNLPHNVGGIDLTGYAMQLAPNAPALYNADGSINWALDLTGKSTWDYPGNPMAQLLNKYKNQTNNLIGNLTVSYRLATGLFIKSSFGYTNLQTTETVRVPLASTAPELRANTTRIGIYGNSGINTWTIEPLINYQVSIGKGKLEALVGSTIQNRKSDGKRFYGFGYTSDDAISDIHSASSVQSGGTIEQVYKYNAIFGRINYVWKEKYIVNLTGRRDGSSRFGANNRFQNFTSVGGAWIFTEEKFSKDIFSFLSFGKIRISYGTTGNDQIGEYRYLSLYTPANTGVPYQGINTLQANSLPNPYIQWEETRKLNFGLDLGFFKERILLNANYFHNRSSNQLLSYQLPVTTGFNSIAENFPATVQNTGLELAVTSTNLENKNFKWTSHVNFTIPKNKLVAFPGIATSTYANSLVVGEPITLVKKFHLIGVDPTTGMYYFDSKTNPFNPVLADDATVLINTAPSYYGGLQNSFSYKGVQLDLLFQFVKQRGVNYLYGRFPGASKLNQPVWVLDRWQKPGDAVSHQKFNSNFGLSNGWHNVMASDAAVADASFARLKNVSLSWQVPEKSVKKSGIKGMRIYAHGQNLLTLTNYKGLDPETLSSYSLPPLRVLTVGVQATF